MLCFMHLLFQNVVVYLMIRRTTASATHCTACRSPAYPAMPVLAVSMPVCRLGGVRAYLPPAIMVPSAYLCVSCSRRDGISACCCYGAGPVLPGRQHACVCRLWGVRANLPPIVVVPGLYSRQVCASPSRPSQLRLWCQVCTPMQACASRSSLSPLLLCAAR